MPNKQPSVAVITSTIGRPELERAILSVQNQTYPCKHYIFVDGEQYHQQAGEILQKFTNNLVVTYLPMNTGANGWTNSSINAIAPFLLKEDIVCFLDDDNWFEPNHVEAGVKVMVEHQADYAYALRNFYDSKGNFVCVDAAESLGDYSRGYQDPIGVQIELDGQSFTLNVRGNTDNHIDTNCYFMTKEVARFVSYTWHSGIHNDRNVYKKLKEHHARGVCTKEITVNYVFEPSKYGGDFNFLSKAPLFLNTEQLNELITQLVKLRTEQSIQGWGGKFIWET